MKKSFVLLVTLLIFISGTVCFAQNALLEEKDQVHFEEISSYGDKSVVDGVTVEMYSEYQRQLFWHTTYTLGEVPKEKTEHTVYPTYQYADGDILENFQLITGSRDAFVMGFMEEKEYHDLEVAMKELYDQTDPGEQNQMIVYLKDYQQYYRLGMELQLPQEEGKEYVEYSNYGYNFAEELEEEIERIESLNITHSDLENYKKAVKDMKNFNEFFKIPVIEDEVYVIAMAKDDSGSVVGSAISSHGGGGSAGDIDFVQMPDEDEYDAFWFDMYSEFDDGECFVTFNPKTMNGKTVDTSQIPGGFGIYRFAYDSEKGTVDSEHIEMVYALNPEVEIDGFRLDESGKNFLIETTEGGRNCLSVIERESMTLVDKFDMGSEDFYSTIYSFEDYMVTTSDTLAVYPMNENGRYEKAFEVEMDAIYDVQKQIIDSEEWAIDIPDLSGSFAWNGQTLLCADYAYSWEQGPVCNFSLAAIDETGLVYCGVYQSTLYSKYDATDNNGSCEPNSAMQVPVIVHWEK